MEGESKRRAPADETAAYGYFCSLKKYKDCFEQVHLNCVPCTLQKPRYPPHVSELSHHLKKIGSKAKMTLEQALLTQLMLLVSIPVIKCNKSQSPLFLWTWRPVQTVAPLMNTPTDHQCHFSHVHARVWLYIPSRRFSFCSQTQK